MTHILITGSNRGLGLEFVRQYAMEENNHIHACCRRPSEAKDLQKLAQDFPDRITIHELDVANHQQIESLATKLQNTPIDILLLNAGIYLDKGLGFGHIDYEKWTTMFQVNTMAPMKMTETFYPHLKNSTDKKVVIITSKMGSIDDNTSGGSYLYRSSKTAVNSVARSLSHDLRADNITVLVLHPGWVVTDMGGPHALIQSDESIQGMKKIIAEANLKVTGQFFAYDGSPIPW